MFNYLYYVFWSSLSIVFFIAMETVKCKRHRKHVILMREVVKKPSVSFSLSSAQLTPAIPSASNQQTNQPLIKNSQVPLASPEKSSEDTLERIKSLDNELSVSEKRPIPLKKHK
ncbi:hypothetical protein M3Y98_00021400 [Aphelenchoides besseyi]|nr:hypothetical protein M3Y98_00021400 [Aphelenchoides besseyi]KAI6199256.1 hypothetical protein M3Y96_00607400 [Aphelenchoides besseyi]